jgi:hypothetical protein
MAKLRKMVVLAQAKVTIHMFTTTLEKDAILEDQSVMALFTLLEDLLVTIEAQEYFTF